MDATSPPAWVRKRDGRLEPFDADKISRALFAAAESLGRPDAFLARELADGVAHFLGDDADGATPSTEQIAELAEKVVRELGQPALAAAFAGHGARRRRGPRPAAAAAPSASLEDAVSACVRDYALRTVFARDLAAAHHDGLLTLTGLEAPCELAACALGAPVADPAEDGVLAAVEKARAYAGSFVVLDGPEYLLAEARPGRPADASALARDLLLGLRLTRLRAVVNLNADAPPWAGAPAGGPLFAAQHTPPAGPAGRRADELPEELLRPSAGAGRVRIYWHLSDRDFGPDAAGRLTRVTRLALEGAPVVFVFDRPRRPVALAEGMDRRHPAVLLTVGVDLPRLAVQPGVDGDPARFLRKLGSLARLALSAGVQQREFLRRRGQAGGPPLSDGFLLDRARLVVAPVGLDAVTRRFTGGGLCAGGAALDFGRQVVQTLKEVLRADGGRARLPACLDGPDDFRLGGSDAAGLTAWEPAAPPRDQWRAAGALHAAAEGGAAALFAAGEPPAPEAAAEWLRQAWRQTEISRVRLARGAASDGAPL